MMENLSGINSTSTLNIFYAGNFSEFSVGEPEIANALEGLGHKVCRFDFRLKTCEQFMREFKKDEYDFVLYTKLPLAPPGMEGRTTTSTVLVDEIRTMLRGISVPKVCWQFDLYWNYNRESMITKIREPVFFEADIVFTSDGGNQERWRRVGINHHWLLQGIDKDVKMGTKMDITPVEVGFIGRAWTWRGWEYRPRLLHWLTENYGERFLQYGGRAGNLRHGALNNVLASLKVTIGDTVHASHYWSNRVYEMLGRGAFLIHPKVDGLEKEFEYYKHFIPYRFGDFKGLKEKIDYYLTHDEEREKIRKAGYEYCHQNYTYTHRVKQFLRVLKQEKII